MVREYSRTLCIRCMEARKGHFQFHTFWQEVCLSLAFYHARHESMAKVVNLQAKVSEMILINCDQDGHLYKTNIVRTFILSFYSHCHDGAFS